MSIEWWADVKDLDTAKVRICDSEDFAFDPVIPYLNFDNKRVLDFGCGIGRNLRYLVQTPAKKIYGFDLPNMIDLAKKFLTKEEKYKIKFLSMPLSKFPDVDIIIALIVFQHLDILLLENYLQMLRVSLNPNGIMYVLSRGYLDHDLGNIWPYILKYFTPITSLYPDDFSENHQTVLFKVK